MKKRMIIMFIFVCLFITGCSDYEPKLEREQILFIYQELYYEGYSHKGFFIDNEGKKYDYDLSDMETIYVHSTELYEYLLENKENYEGETYLSQKELEQWYNYLCAIDSEAELDLGPVVFCAYASALYGIRMKPNNEAELILLKGSGQYESRNLDENAVELTRLWMEKMNGKK